MNALSPTIGLDVAEAPRRVQYASPVEHVYAVHGYGYPPSPTTFLFEDAAQRRPLGYVAGHRPHGAILPAEYGHNAYLLTVVEAR
jgi:hypothetical protein